MKTFEASEQLHYTARQMFDLVASVDLYAEFMPLCERSIVFERLQLADGCEEFDAELQLAHEKTGLRDRFVSRVRLDPGRLEVSAVSNKGPIKHLNTLWAFEDLQGGGCEARFSIEYQMSALPLQLLMSKLYKRVFQKISTAFRERAHVLYGT